MAEKLNNSVEEAESDKPNSEDHERLDSNVNENKKSVSNRGLYVRGDKIDFKNWDIQLEKHLNRVLSTEKQKPKPKPKHDWEIDSSKLDLTRLIDYGTYASVYRGIYDGQDVAGR